MKVLHVFNSLLPSGAEKMWLDASDILRNLGIETHVVATETEIGVYAEEMRRAGFVVHHIPHRTRRLFDWHYCRALHRLLRQNRFDAVQIHPEAWRLTNFLVSRLAGVRHVVTTVHSVFVFRGLRRLRRILTMRLIKMLGGEVVAIGDSVWKSERSYGYAPRQIYNWIDVSRFRRAHDEAWRCPRRRELAIPLDAKLIALVGNCAEVKNHCFFLRMFARLPNEFYALHVGREDEEHCHERALAAELGVADRVLFLGVRNDVKDLLELCDAYVMCSLHEGFSIAALEALAKGLPTVVSDVPGLRDLGALSESCAVVPLDEDLFAKAVENAAHLPKGECPSVLWTKFDISANVKQYVELWRGA